MWCGRHARRRPRSAKSDRKFAARQPRHAPQGSPSQPASSARLRPTPTAPLATRRQAAARRHGAVRPAAVPPARHIGRHLDGARCTDPLATARLHGRVSGALPATAAARSAPSSSPPAAAPGRRAAARCAEAPLEAAVAKPMSALEQMELFEKRLKKQGKSEPKKMSEMEEDDRLEQGAHDQQPDGREWPVRPVQLRARSRHSATTTSTGHKVPEQPAEGAQARASRVFGGPSSRARGSRRARASGGDAENNLGGAMLRRGGARRPPRDEAGRPRRRAAARGAGAHGQ